MSDVSQGVGWWQASDGRWYPPKESDEAPAPGWWLAADGRWYPPVESQDPPEPGWWLAADGRWYPPESTVDASAGADGSNGSTGAHGPGERGSSEHPVRASAPAHVDGSGDAVRVLSAADRPPRTVEEASSRSASSRPRPTDASAQIRRRDDASREDAVAQASARFLAASRALKFLEADIKDHTEPQAQPAVGSTTPAGAADGSTTAGSIDSIDSMGSDSTTPIGSTAISSTTSVDGSTDPGRPDLASDGDDSTPVAASLDPAMAMGSTPDGDAPVRSEVAEQAASAGADGPVDPAVESGEPGEPAGRGEPTGAGESGERAGSPEDAPSPPPAAPPPPPRSGGRLVPDGLLIELRTSPLGTDIDHIGDRLLVFDDRVELRDRNGRVRQALPGDDITDVIVQRKFTGAVLSVESGTGESIVTRGLKPEQADQARLLIHKQTRAGRPATPKSGDDPPRRQRPNPSVNGPKPPDVTAPSPDAVAAAAARLAILNRGRLNEADLLRKLADLHRAGVLTDAEFEDKISLVGRLVSGETLVVS